MSLSQTDEGVMAEEDLRSPHSIHLTIMARYGIPLFALWLYWLYLIFKPLFKSELNRYSLAITSILLAFVVNASFDVYLEGPMGAFPFWTWLGLLFITQSFPPKLNEENLDSIT